MLIKDMDEYTLIQEFKKQKVLQMYLSKDNLTIQIALFCAYAEVCV